MAVVLVLYMVLIPRYGAYGAVVPRCSALAARLLVYLWAQHLWPIHYRWRRHLSLVALCVGVAAGNWAMPDKTILVQVAIGVLSVLAYFGIVYATLLDDEERGLIGQMVRAPASAWAIATKES